MNWYKFSKKQNNKRPDIPPMFGGYIGSKIKFLKFIKDSLKSSGINLKDINTVGDAFSGGGSFSIFMKNLGKDVFSNDFLKSSNLYSQSHKPLEDSDIEIILNGTEFINDDFDISDKYWKDYEDYFYLQEMKFMDIIRKNINLLEREKQDTALFLINQYVNNRKNRGFGYNKKPFMKKDFEKNILFNKEDFLNFYNNPTTQKKLQTYYKDYEKNNQTYNMNAIDFIDSFKDLDLLYLDPPYGIEQTSQYGRMMSFYEDYFFDKKTDLINDITDREQYFKFFKDMIIKSSNNAKTVVLSINSSTVSLLNKMLNNHNIYDLNNIKQWIEELTGKSVDIYSKKVIYNKKLKNQYEIIIIIKNNEIKTSSIRYINEDDDDDDNEESDTYDVHDQADKVFQDSGIYVDRSKELSYISLEDKKVAGAVYSSWTGNTYSFDIAILPEYRGKYSIFQELIDAAISEFYELRNAYGLEDSKMELYVVNPKLVNILKKRYGFKIDKVLSKDRVIMIKE